MRTTVALSPSASGRPLDGRPRTAVAADYAVSISNDWREVSAAWRADEAAAAATPFQDSRWYDALYSAAALDPEVTPLVISVHSARHAQLAVRLPFLLRRGRRLRTVEFADLDLTDYNAPLLGPAAPQTPKEAGALWRQVVRSLPRADVIRLRKMPLEIEGFGNPLALLRGVRPCVLNGNLLITGDDWDAHRYTREKTVRKELERSWRVFTRDSRARFEAVTEPAGIARILDAMEQQQATRMRSIGADYKLDAPLQATFYRELVAQGEGYPLLTALTVGDEIVATLLGIRSRGTYLMVRISNAAGAWTNVSPGRLVIDKTMEHLHAQGVRKFDFSVGNYDYKRRFGVDAAPLLDYTQPLSIAGLAIAARDHAAAKLRQYPELRQRLLKLLGKREIIQEG